MSMSKTEQIAAMAEKTGITKAGAGLCECGCGERTNHRRKKANRYLRGHHRRGVRPTAPSVPVIRLKGEKHPAWKGGHVDNHGYSTILMPEHPRAARKTGYVLEHILIAEKALGKSLPENSVIHHANGTRNSGTIVICQDRAYHNLLHQRMRALKRRLSTS